jgi:hypothetical protein
MTILFSGCSNTAGAGLAPEHYNYAQLVSRHFDEDFDNISVPGRDNQDIFINTLLKIKTNSYTKAVVQWTFTERLGVNAYPVTQMGSVVSTHSIADPNKWFTPQQLRVLGIDVEGVKAYQRNSILLAGKHKSWMDIFLYTDIITTYCVLKGIVPIFVDLALDKTFTQLIQSKKYSIKELPDSVKNIFTQELASDHVIQRYIDSFIKLHNPDIWANFTDPWVKHWIDKATDNSHPGPRSHQWMADQIISHLT